MTKQSYSNDNEGGFASIVIGLVIVMVMSLLTVGFAQLARREQQTALDKQLAFQATDAAESGINDAYKDITGQVFTVPLNNTSSTTCMTPAGSPTGTGAGGSVNPIPPGAATANSVINAADDVRYTCLMVDLQPPSIEFSNLNPGQGEHLTFSTTATPAPLTISWGSSDGKTSFLPAGTTTFAQYDSWNSGNHPGVIQFSITPLNQVDRTSLINNSFTAYLYPSAAGIAPYPYSPGMNGGNGRILTGGCSGISAYPCSVSIAGLPAAGSYLIQVVDYYDSSNILINGKNVGTPIKFIDGQAQVDVTGKAKNVLKRLQVRIPIHPTAPLPSYAVEAQNICKRLETDPTGTTYNNPGFTTPAGQAACSFEGVLP